MALGGRLSRRWGNQFRCHTAPCRSAAATWARRHTRPTIACRAAGKPCPGKGWRLLVGLVGGEEVGHGVPKGVARPPIPMVTCAAPMSRHATHRCHMQPIPSGQLSASATPPGSEEMTCRSENGGGGTVPCNPPVLSTTQDFEFLLQDKSVPPRLFVSNDPMQLEVLLASQA
jgi:hypothetical protein